jgi:hypothetical protein
MHEIAHLAHVTLHTPVRDETVEFFTRYPAWGQAGSEIASARSWGC